MFPTESYGKSKVRPQEVLFFFRSKRRGCKKDPGKGLRSSRGNVNAQGLCKALKKKIHFASKGTVYNRSFTSKVTPSE